jgi:hypothetical protein
MTIPATRLATSSFDWRLDSAGRAPRESVAVLRAVVRSLMRGVTVSSVAVPLETRSAGGRNNEWGRNVDEEESAY